MLYLRISICVASAQIFTMIKGLLRRSNTQKVDIIQQPTPTEERLEDIDASGRFELQDLAPRLLFLHTGKHLYTFMMDCEQPVTKAKVQSSPQSYIAAEYKVVCSIWSLLLEQGKRYLSHTVRIAAEISFI